MFRIYCFILIRFETSTYAKIDRLITGNQFQKD